MGPWGLPGTREIAASIGEYLRNLVDVENVGNVGNILTDHSGLLTYPVNLLSEISEVFCWDTYEMQWNDGTRCYGILGSCWGY